VTPGTTRPRFPLGAHPHGDGTTEVSVWAPARDTVAVRLGDADHPLQPGGDGRFVGTVPAGHGDEYRFVLGDGTLAADPSSRRQPRGLRGPSAVLDPATFDWHDGSWRGVGLGDLVLYELHVATFSPEGTFDGVVPRLAGLRELGVTAIELMPVATFPGRRGWGYDGVFMSAPHEAYGGPAGLQRLVDRAHREGLGVVLDVVFNHVGPGSEALRALGPYFTDRHETFWGDAIDYDHDAVREWAIQCAELYVRDFHVDGLRLDATHAVFDDRRPHVLAELATRVHAANPHALVISEMEVGDTRPIDEWGHDAQWGDELHHALHVLVTGEREGYYAGYGRVADVAAQLERADAPKLVVCAQNHDQVGNRAFGDRLRGDRLRLAATCALLSRGIPLLFMGEEHDEAQPFQFFTDHDDPAIAQATREGRRREFARFAAFAGEDVPDPQAPGTFERSRLRPERGDAAHWRHYQELLRLRRELAGTPIATVVDEERRVLRVRRGDTDVMMNFSEHEVDGVPAWGAVVARGRRRGV
jgi:maltooligosyltrehalose trehalohydrolase